MQNSHIAIATGHHGELVQGAFTLSDGRVTHGLVTLPYAEAWTIAYARRASHHGLLVRPEGRPKTLEALSIIKQRYGLDDDGIVIDLMSNIPTGFGLGSSTTDIVAASRAFSGLLGIRLKKKELFQLAVSAESASDGTMFGQKARLVAHREGYVIERFSRPLPRFALISINVDPGSPVNTNEMKRPAYSEVEIKEFDTLRKRLRTAIDKQDLVETGYVATRSAIINQRYLPQPHFAKIVETGEKHNMVGIQVAHSGRVVGVMLRPETRSKDVAALMETLKSIGLNTQFISAELLF